jgi:shikimate 5-dehydrogenase
VDESPFPDDLFTSDVHLHYDLNYNIDNPLVKRAAEMGIIARDGSSMLVWQALEAFKIWTGREVEFQPLYSTVFGGNDAR